MSTATKPAKTPKPAKAAKAPAPAPTTAAETGVVSIHGVALSFGDTKGGGTAKSSLAAMIPLKSIQIVKGFNPRQHLKDIDELAALIKKDGLL